MGLIHKGLASISNKDKGSMLSFCESIEPFYV